MAESTYALVAYLPGELGQFVNGLRKRFNPRYASWLAHTTILTPRALASVPQDLLIELRERCSKQEPFDVEIAAPGTFWPVNPVVLLSLSGGSERLRHLQAELNTGLLIFQAPYPYVPHVTIAQELEPSSLRQVLADVSEQWSLYRGQRTFRVESLFLVEQVSTGSWRNVAIIPLGGFFYAAQAALAERVPFS